ncbi:MAG: hypothetical protein ACE5OY_01070 [Candidatus Bathyarchaeia archaeon]
MESPKRKGLFPITAILFLLIVVVLTAISLFSAWQLYFVEGAEFSRVSIYLFTGILGLMVTISMLSQISRRYRAVRRVENERVFTVEECDKCNFKSVRGFERGDVIFKGTVKECPKCKSHMTITAIYRGSSK